MADDSAEKLRDVGFAVEEIRILDQFGRPRLKADGIGGDDRPDRERTLCNKDLGSLRFDLRGSLGLRCACTGKHAPCDKCRTDRDDQCSNQQNQLLPIHGFVAP